MEPFREPTQDEQAQDSARPAALGSPHDGYAAVLLTLALAAMAFSLGAAQHFRATVEADHWWWISLAAPAVVVPIVFFALKYYLRAHGANPLHGAPMPWLAMFVAWLALVLYFLGPLVGALGSYWSFAGLCLILATLMVAPVQMVLSHDPKRTSETT